MIDSLRGSAPPPARRSAGVRGSGKVKPAHSDVVSRSRFLRELVQARKDASRPVPNLAAMAGVPSRAIRAMEDGRGPVATVLAVMEALPFRVVGLAKGRTLAEQLRGQREKLGRSVDDVAAKAWLSPREIVELEEGAGSMQALLRLLAAIAPQARRSAPERAYWGAGDKIDRDSRFTPADFMAPIRGVFGEVDLDPCGHPESPVEARRRYMLTDGLDGMVEPWFGRVVWVNPPYSEYKDWLCRVHEQWLAGGIGTMVCLVPARTDGAFFHELIEPNADLYFLRKRVKFIDLKGKAEQTPYALMLVIYGATAEQKRLLAERVDGFWHHRDSSSTWPPYREAMARRRIRPRRAARPCAEPHSTSFYASCSASPDVRYSVTCGPRAS